jgi:hypothetical protein
MQVIDGSMTGVSRMALAAALAAALALGGCQSPMYSGTPDDSYSQSVAPKYAPGTYEPPYGVGGQRDEEEPAQEWSAEQKYEYRGGRDPATGRAKTQM